MRPVDGEVQLQLAHPLVAENAVLFADDFVAQGRGQGIPLDYSPGSIEFLGQVLTSLRAQQIPTAQVADVLFGFGCYLGETIVRSTGASWTTSAGTPLQSTAIFPIVMTLPGGRVCDPAGQPFAALLSESEPSLRAFYADAVS